MMGSDVGYNIGFKLLQDCSNVTFYKYPGNFNGDSPSISPFVYSIRSRQERVPVVSSASTLDFSYCTNVNLGTMMASM